MKNKCNLILLALATFLLTGCNNGTGNKPNEDKTIEVTDMIGRKVKVNPGSYKRIVCVGAGALRLYSYVGDISLLSGVEDIDNTSLKTRPKMFDTSARPYLIANKEAFTKLPSCGVGGPNAQAPESEKILSCNPDLIISEFEDETKAKAMEEQVGVPIITLKYGYKGVFDQAIQDSISLLGKVLDKETKSTKLNKYIADQRKTIEDRTKDLVSNESVYICGLGNWGTTNHLMTAQNYEPLNVVHANNVIKDLPKDGISKIDEEKLISLGDKIDKMFIDAAAIKNINLKEGNDKSTLESIKAWKNKEVYLQMPYNAYYTNVEIALANTWFYAKTIYGEAFKDIDMTKKTNEITKAFLNKELAEEIFKCPTSFGGYQKIDPETFFA